ncbi:MAG TPA: hypothetical protein VGF61_04815 [Candidatus Acidoferrum sp.]|jgi:hypothetical protein
MTLWKVTALKKDVSDGSHTAMHQSEMKVQVISGEKRLSFTLLRS